MTSNIFNDISTSTKSTPKYTQVQPSVKVTDVMPSIPAASTMETDKVDLSASKEPKQKKGPIKSLKTFIANIKKSVATFNEYTKGFFKGIKNAAIFGSIVYTGGSIINYFKTKAASDAKKLPNKALAIATAVIAIGVNLWTASLNASEKRSDVDHRWTGHEK